MSVHLPQQRSPVRLWCVIDAGSPNALLLRHFASWAAGKHPVDCDMLDDLLQLRSTYDELEPTYWPAGSVEHLLLERWPSKGAVDPPDQEALVRTLDAYFRFLRNTGRMSSRSADPKSLAKEARRSAAGMAEAAADVEQWSPTKVLMDFGRSQGIDFDDAPDVETLQARLLEVQNLWNALPTKERQQRMPGTVTGLPAHDPALEMSGRDWACEAFDIDDEIIALLMTFSHRLPKGELPLPEKVAPIFQAAPYMRDLLALVDWVGAAKEITGTRVLRPKLAHEAYDALGLDSWTRQLLRRRYPDERFAGVAKLGLENWIEQEATRPWNRAAECDALHRLWFGAVACGAIALSGGKAAAVDEPDRDAERWVAMGVRSAVAMMNLLCDGPGTAAPLVFAMMTSYVTGRAPVSKDEILDFAVDWTWSPKELDEFTTLDIHEWERPLVDATIGRLADTGLFVETPDSVTLTDAGDVFVTAWLDYVQDR